MSEIDFETRIDRFRSLRVAGVDMRYERFSSNGIGDDFGIFVISLRFRSSRVTFMILKLILVFLVVLFTGSNQE